MLVRVDGSRVVGEKKQEATVKDKKSDGLAGLGYVVRSEWSVWSVWSVCGRPVF